MAKIYLNIEAEDAGDLQRTLLDLAQGLTPGTLVPSRDNYVETVVRAAYQPSDMGAILAAQSASNTTEPPKKRGRPAKTQGEVVLNHPQEDAASAVEPLQPEASAPSAPASSTATHDDLIRAMQEATKKPGGMIEVRKIIASYMKEDGAPALRASDVPLANVGDAIERIQAI